MDPDDCNNNRVCEWHGPKPDGCHCKSGIGHDCTCNGRKTMADCNSQSICKWHTMAENWMEAASHAIGGLTLLDLTLPGTHDTLTFDMSNKLPENSDSNPMKKETMQAYQAVIGEGIALMTQETQNIIKDSCKNQVETLTRQLDLGVRFFDWRMVNDVNWERCGTGTGGNRRHRCTIHEDNFYGTQ